MVKKGKNGEEKLEDRRSGSIKGEWKRKMGERGEGRE